MRRDWIAGLVLLALSIGYYLLATDIPRSQLSDAVGASTFPKLLAAALALLSVLLVISGAVRDRKSETKKKSQDERRKELLAFLRAGGTVLIGIGFLIVVNWLGYPIGVALLLAAMLLYNHVEFGWKLSLVAVVGGLFFWFLFGFLFNVPVPNGIWPKVFGI